VLITCENCNVNGTQSLAKWTSNIHWSVMYIFIHVVRTPWSRVRRQPSMAPTVRTKRVGGACAVPMSGFRHGWEQLRFSRNRNIGHLERGDQGDDGTSPIYILLLARGCYRSGEDKSMHVHLYWTILFSFNGKWEWWYTTRNVKSSSMQALTSRWPMIYAI
jgi:hypothetical protein